MEFGKEGEITLWTLAKTKKAQGNKQKKPIIKACEGSWETQREMRITITGQEASSGRKVLTAVHPRGAFLLPEAEA